MAATTTRPLGPRQQARSPTAAQPESTTQPLIIKKKPPTSPSIDGLLSPNGHPSPGPSLSLNVSNLSRPSTPKPSLKVNLASISTASSSDSPTDYSYYGGGVPMNPASAPAPEEPTIRPDIATCIPAAPKHKTEPVIVDIQSLIGSFSGQSSASGSDPESSPPDVPRLAYSDSDLEEIARLGEGAGGAVHKVKDKRNGQVMARKTITTRGAPMHQLLRELSFSSSAVHRNIIPFYGAYMSPSSSEVKILMELCEGGSLEAIGKRIKERGGIIGEKIAGRIAEGVLQGLAYLHSKKIIHRDIKPSNILLSREGVVILCDFGVSGQLEGSIAGTFTGTSFYMAPERISGHEYTIRSDVWSTGISLLELVQNRFPFPNDLPPIELMMHITTADPPRLEDEPGVEWSPEMKDFIKQTLTVDAQSRPIPKVMLEHPWIISVMKQEVHMAKWIAQVWDWPRRKRREHGDSRPDTANGTPSGDDSPSSTSAQ